MSVVAAPSCWWFTVVVLVVGVGSLAAQAQGQGGALQQQLDEGSLVLKSGVANVSDRLATEMKQRASFCILDEKTDWNRAFNYSNWDFLTTCMKTTQDAASRLCTEAEIRAYLGGFLNEFGLQANKNCNLTSWVAGCEPGWACSTGTIQDEDLINADREIPARTFECKKCCEGFFCPQGLTCMMPCPLGSYCPLATFNGTSGLCTPYNYQLPPGRNHTCGGANIWADVSRSRQVFCPAGSYCPTTTEKEPCSSGHYCMTGSTSQTRCSKLISCKKNSEEQNIHTYGIMLIIALVALLLIIYNFSDQILSIRERRRARKREGAVRRMQQKERAQAKWKVAKDAVKEHAGKLHANLSRRFSHRNHPENFKILHDLDAQEDTFPLSTHNAGNSSEAQPSSVSLEGPTNPASLGVDKHNFGGLGIEIEGKNSKQKVLREKHIRTDSEIFTYAYAQIEKEKFQQKQYENLTFSGVVSLATGDDIKKRPMIEVGFKDLTLTLKGKQRCLLKNLNGKLIPGRITAVMGPSGAGKTTFMSALAGKETGCTKSGLVLINGKPESIYSYKKIVGFVPQDDIVHGNLTVEENLRFSAWCRLPTKLSRAEKVLIVERVLLNLGLQEVRDSLVGTVEKRGISGGQKKRVNVGLEMVIEPSLLFLDEPTSGLDSSSSRLLLKALKHEALAGVNICMVVHQPSYALFKMFDDLILLAKGGLMAYHGPVNKLEEYFGGIGINVPERVNPPDHYIDILEGLVDTSQSSSINYKDLPLRWMLHNGYLIPEDMQSRAAELRNQQESESSGSGGELQSFTTEIWQDLRSNVEKRRDHIHHYFLKQKDLANRGTPCVILQYKYFLGRVTKQRLRESQLQATDYLILLLAGACLGAITKISDVDFGAAGYTYTIIAISLLCQIAALRTFSLDKLQYLRESASGISSLAHFLAKDTVDHFNTVIKPVVFLSMFYFLTNPRSTFLDNYIILVCLVYCVTGMGYAFAIFLNPGPAQLFSVLFPVCFTLIASQSLKNEGLKGIAYLCYPKWATEALVIANARRYYGVWLINRCGVLQRLGYDVHAWRTCILILIAYGLVSRVIAFISLLIIRKK